MDGGSIIMPIDIKVEETTMSISMNGIYSTNPIMKARCNSQVINDGTTTRSGSFIAVSVSISAPTSIWAKSQNMVSVVVFVLRSINSFKGTSARLRNSS